MSYVVQNGARLLRAIFEIAMQRSYAQLAISTLSWAHILEKRILPGSHVLRQFSRECSLGKLTNPNATVTKYGYIQDETLYRLESMKIDMDKCYARDYQGLTRYVSPAHMIEFHKFLSYVPRLELEV